MTSVVFISGRTLNDALGAAGRSHRVLFEALGHDYIEINFAKPEAQELLNRTVREQSIAFAYSAVGMGADIHGTTLEGKEINFWQANRIPFISLNGDSPAYFFDRHVMPSPWHACLYCYPEHLEFRKRLKPAPAIYGTIPPFARDQTEKGGIDFRKKEGGKLLFLKNGNDPNKLVQTWREAMSPETFVVLAGLASELANDIASEVGYDIDALVTSHFLDRGWDITEFINLRLFFVAQLDDYLRRVKSLMLAEVIADFPVEIHGYNWEHFNFSGKKATFIPGGDYTQSKDEIIDSLGIIDMSPNTQLAPHDRPARAFGLWTLCITNEQRYFRDNFSDSAMFCYRFDKEHLREKIADVLAHPKRYVELGLDVAQQFQQHCRPEDFAQYLVDTANFVRLACGGRAPGLQDFFVWPPTKVQ